MMPIHPTLWFPKILATSMVAITAVSDQSVSNVSTPVTPLWLTAALLPRVQMDNSRPEKGIHIPDHGRHPPAPWSPWLLAQSPHQIFFPIPLLAKDKGQVPLASISILPWTSQTFYWLQETWLKPNCFCQPSCVPGLCRVTAKDRNKFFVYSGNWRAALTSG